MEAVQRKGVSCFFHLSTAISVVMAEISCYEDKKVLRLLTMKVHVESRNPNEQTSFLDFTVVRTLTFSSQDMPNEATLPISSR